MQKIIRCLCIIMLSASMAGAADIGWSLDDDGIGPQDSGNWNDPNNWTLGRIPADDDKVKFYSGTAKCIIDGPVVGGQLVMGDNGDAVAPEENFIHIMPGGNLITGTFGSWHAVGYNRPAKMIVERGGMWDAGDNHVWVGMKAGSEGSILEINGGTVKTDNNHALQLARQDDGAGGCRVYLNAGVFECGRLANDDLIRGTNSSIDIRFGTLIFHRTNIAAAIQNEVDAGYLTAFGGHGNDGQGSEIVITVGNGVTTITATDPMEASPAYGQEDVYYEDVVLSWKNKDPNGVSNALVDVWFGQLEEGATEPNKLGPLYNKIVDGKSWSEYMSVIVGELDEETGKYYLPAGEYYWHVELVNSPNPDPIGPVYYFTVTDNRTPWNVDAGADVVTWINEPTPLLGSYEDENTPTVVWTSGDPGVVFSPSDDGGLTSTAINPTVTVGSAGPVTLTFTVDDGVNPAVSDTVTVDVYEDACQAARTGAGEAANHPADLTGPAGVPDCNIDLIDIAVEIAAKWLDDYALTEPVPQP